MRAKKTLKNLIFNLLQQIVSIVTGFILPPLIIQNYGSSINGLISTIKQIVMYAQTTGAGIASASTYVMYQPLAERNYKKLSGIFNATRKMFVKAGNLSSLIMLLVAFIYPLFVRNDVDVLTTICLIILLGACGVSEFYFIGKYQALFSADQKNYLVSIAQGLGNIFNIVISIILIKFNCNIILVEFGAMTVYIVRVVVLWTYFKKNYTYIDKKEKPLMNEISQRRDAIIHEITALIINNSSIVLISLLIGLKNASIYNVYMLVFSGLNMICNIVSNGIYASFGDVVSKKEDEVLKKAYDVFEFTYMIMISAIYTIAYILIMPFIKIYTQGMTDANYVLPILGKLFVLVGFINNLKIPSRTMVIASGHFKQTKKYSVIEMIINLLGQVILMYFWGIYGALLGCLLAAIYRAINFIWYSNKYILKISNNIIIKRVLLFLAVACIIIGFYSFEINLMILNYLQWFTYAIIISTTVGIIFLITGAISNRETFKETVKILKGIIIRR